ncbi:hypothetical protein FNQ90_10760 [Streptomyces alkaliphilus]|uniref:Uncharacterized protein n=1 Tax=Streptomyces alkaliphilus TaxID=1472722 RepID=A0A7W3Y1R7_9ACTN|nr:hypothetical protein [Streptomyces alkaliphilus]MBB0244570.1 hypothetical protein [Streptomyces alkaliphilus]
MTIGENATRARTLQEAQFAVMEALTDLLARDPEAASQGVLMAKRAFSEGTVRHALQSTRMWQTVVVVLGEPVPIRIRKTRWW